MNLQWKFWRRTRDESPAPPPAVAPPQTAGWLPLASTRELLGLQRVIGNQAVLDLLALRTPRSISRGEFGQEKLRWPLWRKTRRD